MKTMISKWVAIVLLFTIAVSNSFAQTINLDEVPGCLVTDVTRKVTYTEPGNPSPKPVTAGMVLADDAVVYIGKKSSITLVKDDQSLVVSKKGSHQMANLTAEVKAKGEVSRFAKMAFAAKGYVKGDTTKKVKGWGDKDSILFMPPLKGKISLTPLTVKWTKLKPGSIYRFTLYHTDKENPLLQAITSGSTFGFDPNQLSIQLGQTYNAQVELLNDKSISSKVIQFNFVAVNEVEHVLASLKKENEFINGSLLKRCLMEATELENNQFYGLAAERYQNAVKIGDNSYLDEQMNSAFLERISQ